MAIDTEERKDDKPTNSTDGVAASKGNKKVLVIVLSVLGVLLILGIIGSMAVGFLFKKGAESFIDVASGGNVKLNTGKDGGEVTIGGKDGDKMKMNVGDNAKLPEDYPKSDVPVYKNAKIVSSTDMTIESAKSFSVQLQTSDSISEVTNFYKDKLSSGDWKQTYSSNTTDNSSAMYQSESKQLAVTMSVSKDDEGTNISLSVRQTQSES